MSKRRRRIPSSPYAVHELRDSERHLAVVRYDGDVDVFTALAWAYLIGQSASAAAPIQAPQPRLYRCNPDRTGLYEWTLGRPDKPGPGVFTGALITLARRPAHASGPIADTRCHACTAESGERHERWCCVGRVIEMPVFAETLADLRPRALWA